MKQELQRLWHHLSAARPEPRVVFDDLGITRTFGDLTEHVTWEDLERIEIQTTDEGPFVEDLFWLLHGSDGGVLIPGGLMNAELLERLQELERFDNMALIAATGSTDNARFLIWRRAADVA